MEGVWVMKRRWNIHQIYFYVVCFVTLIMVISGITSVVRAGIQMVIPIPDTDRPYFDKPYMPGEAAAKSSLPKEVIEEEIAKQQAFYETQQKTYSFYNPLLMVINGLVQILVAVPVYLYHWRKIPLIS
jgi:hypothetical protein